MNRECWRFNSAKLARTTPLKCISLAEAFYGAILRSIVHFFEIIPSGMSEREQFAGHRISYWERVLAA
ncbi:hypothetical protein [Polystyrenella longa]|uniref:hypothetical protein n=1 Tax=Polystyrenella longa TaxID=2528007 RepID=UPI0018D27299|nr:hypothetical protein [Polystyrenella longa]